MLLAFIWIAAAAYLLGSVPVGFCWCASFAARTSALWAAATSAQPTCSVRKVRDWALATFVLDVVKGASAVLLGAAIAGPVLPMIPQRNVEALAALFAVFGHMFPVWLRFRGGKGVATGFGVFLVAAPWAALAAITLFAIVFAITRYVSLASIIGAASFPVFAWFMVRGERPAFFVAAQSIVALLIIVKHHPNIRRLLAGNEHRFGAAKTA